MTGKAAEIGKSVKVSFFSMLALGVALAAHSSPALAGADTVVRFPADAELFAQLAHRKARTLRQHHKSNHLFHRGYIFPRHMPKSVTHHPGSFVTYLAGSYPKS